MEIKIATSWRKLGPLASQPNLTWGRENYNMEIKLTTSWCTLGPYKKPKKLQNSKISAKISQFHAARSEAERVRETWNFLEIFEFCNFLGFL